MKSVQIKAEYDQLLKMRPVNKSGSALGTHRFQRAVVARGALKSNGATRRDCTLEAMRTQARATQRSLQWIFICSRTKMQNEKNITEYWTESTLIKERGWSKGRIAKLLKNPDKLVPNPHYRTAPKMRLYAQSRVVAAETLPEFVTFKTSAPKRTGKAATQREQQRQSLINRLSCPSVAPLVIYETIVKQRLTPFNESSFPEAFCRDMPEMLWLALSPRPEFEAEAIDIVVRIVLAALDSRAGRHRYNALGFDQVERIFDIWHAQLDLKTSAGIVDFTYVFTEAIAPNDKKGLRLAERRGYALERLNTISTRKWSVGPSFFQKQIAHDDEWLFFAH